MQIYKDEQYLLGNASLHLQLGTAMGIMTHLICNSNHPPSAPQMAEALEISVRYLRKLLRLLVTGDLLKPHPRLSDTWVCSRAPHLISLADVYRCLLIDAPEGKANSTQTRSGAAPTAADLLMMQVTMTINQLLLQHLQKFDLGCLKMAESAAMCATSLRARAAQLDPFTEPFQSYSAAA